MNLFQNKRVKFYHVKCPKCENTELRRIRRSSWMRLLPNSYYYRCSDCKHRFISFRSDWMFPAGAILFGLGEGLIILASSAEELGIGYPGLGTTQRAGAALGAVVALGGYVLITSCLYRWSTRALQRYKKQSSRFSDKLD